MSNNLVSQQLPIPGMQMGQLEPILNKVDPSVQDMQMGLMGSVSNDPASHQRSLSDLSSNPGLQRFSMSNIQTADIDPKVNNPGLQQFFISRPMETMLNNAGSQQLSAPIKRKAPMESLYDNNVKQQFTMPNKRVAQMEHRPWLQQVSAPNKRAVQIQAMSTTPGSQHLPTPKRVSNKSGSQRSSIPKNQIAMMQPSPKASTESFELVRSKMRESLAAALDLVTKQQDKILNSGKNSQSEAATASGQSQENSQPAESTPTAADTLDHVSEEPKMTLPLNGDCSAQKSNDGRGSSVKILADENTGDSTRSLKCDGQEIQTSYVLPGEEVSFNYCVFAKDELLQGNGLSWVLESDMEVAEKRENQTSEKQKLVDELGKDRKEEAGQSPQILAHKIEAELFKLFGGVNKKYKEKGRSLLFNLKDRNNPALRERVMSGEIPPERLCTMTAEDLASEELSQWRIAKAEEFAQMVVLPDSEVDIRRLVKKTHKGEFQVEVEQDESVPMDVSVGASSLASSQSKIKEMEASPPSKPDGTMDTTDASGEKSNLEDQGIPYTLTIPSNEGTDLMQGLMVDDALKDPDFLPPIVSLDEFMESLDSEPPFENLPVDAGKISPISDKDDSDIGSDSKSSDLTPKDDDFTADESEKIDQTYSKSDADEKSNEGHVDVKPGDGHADVKCDGLADVKISDGPADVKPSDGQADVKSSEGHADVKSGVTHADVKSGESYADVKSGDSHAKTDTVPQAGVSRGEHVWEGLLQLNISAMASVIGIFKSGEKTSAKEWPSFLEIKGRVRVDAFEKFLQELPLSRSRAVMVVHFVTREGSPNAERANLHEVADSYVLDERVGFAEPAPGVELYFCPPHNRTRDMLSKILPKEHIEALNNIDNGLIGVIVWRKAQLTSRISPNSSSHHKHGSKKQNFTSRRQQETNMNANFTPKPTLSQGVTPTNFRPPQDDDDDDDVPPGFGPAAARDEDDLPEFNFSGGSTPSVQKNFAQNPSRGPGMAPIHSLSQTPSNPVDQMRELIHKYGQPKTSSASANWQDKRGFGVAVQPWNDDDDDIPEWNPQQAPQQQLTHPQTVHSFQQPLLRPHMVNQQQTLGPVPPLQSPHQSMLSLQPPMNVAQAPQGNWWVPSVQGNNLQPSNLGCQANVGQFYGATGRGGGQPGHAAWRQNAPQSRGFG